MFQWVYLILYVEATSAFAGMCSICMWAKILETKSGSEHHTTILDGNKGENQSLCQSALTVFSIIWHRLSVFDQLPIKLSLNVFLIQSQLSKTLISIQRAVFVLRELISLFSTLRPSAVATFNVWLSSHRVLRYKFLGFFKSFLFPSLLLYLAKWDCKDSFPAVVMNPSWHKSVHTSVHLSRQPLSQVTNIGPSVIQSVNAWSLVQNCYYKPLSSLSVKS